MKKKLLLVCVENSNRRQMSQAFAIINGGDQIEAFSAGSKQSGIVNPKGYCSHERTWLRIIYPR
jgi:protein-tyrosine-phosphatase